MMIASTTAGFGHPGPAPFHAQLKARQRAIRDSFPPKFGLRIHRALSWLGRAEQETGDDDARFPFLWIADHAHGRGRDRQHRPR